MSAMYVRDPETGKFIPVGGGGGSAIDDTTPSTVTVYSSKKTQDEIDRLDEQINEQKEANAAQDERMAAIEKTVAGIPGSETSLQAFIDNTDIDYAYDSETGANYTVIRVYKNKLDGSKQYPFVYAPNGAGAGTKSTYDMTVGDGWLLAINAGVFNTSTKKPDGIVIQNGVVIQNGQTVTHSQNKPLTIDGNGNLGSAEHDADADALVSAGIVSAVAGFIPIIVDYAPVPQSEWNSISHYTQNAQRQIIGQFGNGDYAIVTCEGRNFDNSDGWTIAEAQTVCKKLGLKFAYNLDGGGSTETMLGYKHINTIYENTTGRIVPTFIVFNGLTTLNETPVVPDDGDDGDETEVTLSSISATYSGGDVTVGTAVSALTGITVTANYSDGSTATVTDYTLSGTIAEGSNTITVSYGGKTTTITVTGVASGSDDDETVLYQMAEPTTFNGTSDYIDTGLAILAEKSDFSIVFDVQGEDPGSVNAPIAHMMYEATPYPGISIYQRFANDAYYIGAGTGKVATLAGMEERFVGVFTYNSSDGSCKLNYRHGDSSAMSDKKDAELTWEFSAINTTLVIGAYQNTNGSKGRYWKGTMNDFAVYSRVLTDDEITAYLNS